MYYVLGLRSLGVAQPNCVVADIGETLEIKLAAIACYQTQFAHRPELLERLRVFNQHQGQTAGFAAGEVFASPSPLGTRDLMKLVFGG
jgi:LmbE family N-acetylglucosaminyl deacetylase